MRTQRTHRDRRGFMLMDVIVGLIVVAVLTVTLGVAVTKQRRASDRLGDSRESARLAEQTLTALQTAVPPPAAPEGATVSVRRDEATKAPDGCMWAVVTVTQNGRSVDLCGIVRKGADAASGGKQ